MPRVFYDDDVDPAALSDELIAVLGYAIQGRAQALNLRDSGASVVVGNRRDRYWDSAQQDGFDVRSIDEAVERGGRTRDRLTGVCARRLLLRRAASRDTLPPAGGGS
jgi:ketol-acid reductoisomerase